MHHIYHTDAIVLSYENSGEANRNFLLYTKELGFIYAHAQSVRLEKSKLRFALQPYTLARIALVRGKAIWRITTATPASLFFENNAPKHLFETFQNITGILKDLIPVEIADNRLFDDLRNAFLCMGTEYTTIDKAKNIELCLMLRILHYLGYVPEDKNYKNILDYSFSFHTFSYQELPKNDITKTINNALFATAK